MSENLTPDSGTISQAIDELEKITKKKKAKKTSKKEEVKEETTSKIKRVPDEEYSIVISNQFSSLVRLDHLYGLLDNNETTLMGSRKYKTLKTEDFLKRVMEQMGMAQEGVIYPKGCRHIEKGNGSGSTRIYVVEEEPSIRTIATNVSFDHKKLTKKGLPKNEIDSLMKRDPAGYSTFRASFPYIVYLIAMNGSSFAGMKVFYRLSPISSLGDYLLITNLLNIDSGQSICMGSGQMPDKYEHNISEAINVIISSFWESVFTHDYHGNVDLYKQDGYVGNYYEWAYHTKINPLFIYNIKWVKYDKTLGQEVDTFLNYLTGRRSRYSDSLFSLPTLVNSISSKVKAEKPSDFKSSSTQFFENTTESIYIPGACLSCGDELLYEDKKYNIYSFVGSGSNPATHVKLQDQETKEIKEVRITNSFIDIITREFEKVKEFDSIIIKKKRVKINDIIKLNNISGYDGYYSVEKIRLGIDGNYEICLGGTFYNAKTLDLEIFNINDLKFNGKRIKEGETIYLYSTDSYFNALYPVKFVRKFKFEKIVPDQYNRGKLVFQFINSNGATRRLSGENNQDIIKIKKKDIEKDADIFRIGSYVFDISKFKNYFEGIYFDPKTAEVIFVENESQTNFNHGRAFGDTTTRRLIDAEKLLIENGTRLFIPSYDVDIDFKIGDKVVIADWSDSARSTVIREVTGFINNGDTATLDIITTSLKKENPETRQDRFVYLNNGEIEFGYIRKVVDKIDGYSVGDKIQAKIKGIADFPMTNINQISAFIVDGGTEPLVLCSNAATLWFSQLKDEFTHIKRRSKKWLKSEISEIRKYRNVFGNLVKDTYNNNKGILMEHSSTNLSYNPGSIQFYYLKDSIFRNREYHQSLGGMSTRPYGYQIPKLTDRQYIEESEGIKCYPNLLGGFTPSSKLHSPIIRLRKKKTGGN